MKLEKLITNPLVNIFSQNVGKKVAMIAEVPLTKRRFVIVSPYFELLHFASSGVFRAEIIKFLSTSFKIGKTVGNDIVNQLINTNLLVTKIKASNKNPIIETRNRWIEHNWEAAFYYHLWTKDYPFIDYSENTAATIDVELMHTYSQNSPPPPVYKEYESKIIKLEPIEPTFREIRLRDVLGLSKKDIATRPLDFKRLSSLLYLTFGEIGSIQFVGSPRLVLKTSPSGGARHPIEAYLIILRPMDILPPGIYHYSVKNNALVPLREGDFYDVVNQIVFSPSWNQKLIPTVIIVTTAVVERAMWRYRDPRAYRPVVHDFGHILGTLHLVANSLGINHFLHHGFDEARMAELLEIDKFSEPPFFFGAFF